MHTTDEHSNAQLLFGLSEAEVSEAVGWHLAWGNDEWYPSRFRTDASAEKPDTSAHQGVLDLALAQLSSPFECWKFGTLCEATGPDAAVQLVEAFWSEAIMLEDTSILVESSGERFEVAHELWLGEYELDSEDQEKYDQMVGIERSNHRLSCGTSSNITYHPSASDSQHIRVRAGVTNLALYVSTWANTQYFEDGSNKKSDVCIDGTGYGTVFYYNQSGQVIGSSDLPDPYDLKCKNTKKVTTNRNWWGGVYDSYGSEGIGTGAEVWGSGYACRPSI